jgi:hypothetical protein
MCPNVRCRKLLLQPMRPNGTFIRDGSCPPADFDHPTFQ